MADGRNRSGPPEDSSSSRARQRFAPPNYPDARRRNMMKCIAAVLIVLGMIMMAGATPPCSQDTGAYLRDAPYLTGKAHGEDLHRRKAFQRTSAKNTYIPWYLIPGTWYTSTRYCCVRVLHFKTPPFATSYSYGNFLSAGLGSSPMYSSIISVWKA